MTSPAITLSAEKTVSGGSPRPIFLVLTFFKSLWVLLLGFCVYLPSNKVCGCTDAAVLMLKNKIHRIPIVNESNQVVGKWIFWNCFADYVVLVLMSSSSPVVSCISSGYDWKSVVPTPDLSNFDKPLLRGLFFWICRYGHKDWHLHSPGGRRWLGWPTEIVPECLVCSVHIVVSLWYSDTVVSGTCS